MSEGGGRQASHDGRGFLNELIVFQRLDHKKCEVGAPGEVALQDGIAHVFAPYGQPLAFSFFKVAAAHQRPLRIAFKYLTAGFDLVLDIRVAQYAGDPAEHFEEKPELSGIDILAVPADMPAAGEDEAAPGSARSSTARAVPVE